MTWSRRWGEEKNKTVQWTVSRTNTSISKSQVSRLCEEIDKRVQAFLNRPIEGQWPGYAERLNAPASVIELETTGKLTGRPLVSAPIMARTSSDLIGSEK